MNPTPAAPMMPPSAAPSLTMPAPAAGPAMEAPQALPPAASTPDSFAPQAGAPAAAPQPSDAEIAALMQMLNGGQQPGGPQPAGAAPTPGGMPPAPGPAGLQAGPNGTVLEQNPLATGGTPAGLMNTPIGKGVAFLAVATAAFFGFKFIKGRKAADVVKSAFDKLEQNAKELPEQIKAKLGNQAELDKLHTETKETVDKTITQHNAAINGVSENQKAADALQSRTDTLFEHAKGLPEDGSLKDKVVADFNEAVANFKAKVLGKGDEA